MEVLPLTPLLRARTDRVGVGLCIGLLSVLGFVPQLGGPGYDAALVAGLVLPATTALITARVVARSTASPTQALARGIQLGLALDVAAVLIELVHGLRVGLCDWREGLALFALGPAVGALLGGASGAAAGVCAAELGLRPKRRAALALVLALAGPVLGIVVSLVRFYTSPMVFAYDPYFGYFSGPLYDTVILSLEPLLWYRLGSLGTLGALSVAASVLVRRGDGRLGFALRGRGNALGAGLFAAAVSGVITLSGASLGHYSTAGSIEQALGRRLSAGRCDVIYSSSVLEGDARRLGRECHAHLAQVERFFDVSGPERVRVLLFANDGEKARLMGAAHTYIAKPWRGEVYVQVAGFPHPVLGHELAHVVAGTFGRGPFRIAGLLAGLVPDPGRIEGVATAAAPDENDALTLEEWAAAMNKLHMLPPIDSLFRLSFFGHNAAQAYTAAGAFVRFVRQEFGAAAVRRWYAGESLETVTKLTVPALEARFRRSLEGLTLSDAVLANARARFERPAFFDRRCPRVIDRRAGEANGRLGAGDLAGARESYRAVLALDPHDSAARLGLAACSARAGNLAGALLEYAGLARADDLAPWARLNALEGKADVLMRQGQYEQARAEYDQLSRLFVDEDRLRTLDVKSLATAGLAREAIFALLIGDELGASWDVAAPKLGEWSALNPAYGLADYLLGKNLYNRGRLKEAALALDRALGRTLPEPRVLDEALRLRMVVACALIDEDAAGWAFERLRARSLSRARWEGIERLAERCSI
jgi:tetratricopeptide (TPR) repeat protein